MAPLQSSGWSPMSSPHQVPPESQGKVERRWEVIGVRLDQAGNGVMPDHLSIHAEGWCGAPSVGELLMPVSEHREEVERLERELQAEERNAAVLTEEAREAEATESAIDKVVEELERRAAVADRCAKQFRTAGQSHNCTVEEGAAVGLRQAADLLRKARASKEGE